MEHRVVPLQQTMRVRASVTLEVEQLPALLEAVTGAVGTRVVTVEPIPASNVIPIAGGQEEQ